MSAERIQGVPRDMVWGVQQTEGPHAGMRIGEIWFDAHPLLVKFITTRERLSVQVHPDDAYAAKHESHRGGRGKTEIWHVVSADPGAEVALGFREPMTREEIRAAAETPCGQGATSESLAESLAQKMRWRPVGAGDTVFVPAGTVHALGAGIEICEIQQHCDITYRLFDYGRGRELHLDRGLDVIAKESGLADGAGFVKWPFAGEYFKIESAMIEPGMSSAIGPGHLVVIDGEGTIDGKAYSSREVWKLSSPVEFRPARETQSLLVNI